MRLLMLFLTVATTPEPPFVLRGEYSGVRLEARPVPGSKLSELRLTAVTSGEVERLCAVAFGTGKFDPQEPYLRARQILSEQPNERLTYEQLMPPLVSPRDLVVRARRTHTLSGQCRVDFWAEASGGPAPKEGWVRIEKLSGFFVFDPLPAGQVKVLHQVHMDLGGSLPAWMVESTRKDLALAWVHRILQSGSARGLERPGHP